MKTKTVKNPKFGNKTSYFRNSLLAFLGLLVVALSVFVTIEVSTSGAEVAKLEQEELALQNANRGISEELARTLSLTSIGKEASNLGFSRPEKVVYISREMSVAAKLP